MKPKSGKKSSVRSRSKNVLSDEVYLELIKSTSIGPSFFGFAVIFVAGGLMICREVPDPTLILIVMVGAITCLPQWISIIRAFRRLEFVVSEINSVREWEINFAIGSFCFCAFLAALGVRTFLIAPPFEELFYTASLCCYSFAYAVRAYTRPWICVPSILIAFTFPASVVLWRATIPLLVSVAMAACVYITTDGILILYHRRKQLAITQKELSNANQELGYCVAELEKSNRSKEKLFTIVAHDLLAPVGSIKETLNRLNFTELDKDEHSRLHKQFHYAIDLLFFSLKNLLAWAATQLELIRTVPQRISLQDSAGEAIEFLENLIVQKNLILENHIPVDVLVWADEEQVGSIFRNLLSNAIKFTPEGGRIQITVKANKKHWEVIVSDTGIGMSRQQIEQLFDFGRIRSTSGIKKEKGVGLGLKISYQFVFQNKGEIWAESVEGSGSQLHFTLPCI